VKGAAWRTCGACDCAPGTCEPCKPVHPWTMRDMVWCIAASAILISNHTVPLGITSRGAVGIGHMRRARRLRSMPHGPQHSPCAGLMARRQGLSAHAPPQLILRPNWPADPLMAMLLHSAIRPTSARAYCSSHDAWARTHPHPSTRTSSDAYKGTHLAGWLGSAWSMSIHGGSCLALALSMPSQFGSWLVKANAF